MPEKLFFVMATVYGGMRYLGTMTESAITDWEINRKIVVKLHNPKFYIEIQQQQQQPSPPRALVVPTYIAEGPQKEISIHPDVLHLLEILGEVQGEGNSECCIGAQEFYQVYKDSLAQWAARLSGLKAPTPEDIARINRKGGKGGPVLLK